MEKIGNIMLIDDNEADNVYHKIIIERAGIAEKVISFSSSIEALEYLKKCFQGGAAESGCVKPDLIFLDINLPAMSGYELLDKLKLLPDAFNRQLKIVVLTGSLNPEDAQIAKEKYKDQIAGFEIKPITIEMLHILNRTIFHQETEIS